MPGIGAGRGSTVIWRVKMAAASARAAAPMASADRSIVLALMVTPARPDSSLPAWAKETSAPARAVISERPGDSEPC
jgi:hypothetical protein